MLRLFTIQVTCRMLLMESKMGFGEDALKLFKIFLNLESFYLIFMEELFCLIIPKY